MKTSVVIIHHHLYKRAADVFNGAVSNSHGLKFICIESSSNRKQVEENFLKEIKNNNAIAGVLDSKPYSNFFFDSLPNNFLLSRYGVGTNNIAIPILNKKNIALATTKEAATTATAEHTFALLLALAKNIFFGNDCFKNKQWIRKEGISLKEKKLCILGLGSVGSEVARIAIQGFGMHVYALVKPGFNEANNAIAKNVETFTINALPTFLQKSNFISLHLPLTQETNNILNAQMLGCCKKGALIINTARAALLDENALVEKLKSNYLGGAALDVFKKEPYIIKNNSLDNSSVPNLILSPHVACHTPSANIAIGNAVVNNIVLFLQNKCSKMNIVNTYKPQALIKLSK